MKNLLAFFLFVVFPLLAFSQSKAKYSLIATLSPALSYTFNTVEDVKFPGSQYSYARYNDSVRQKESSRFTFGLTAWINRSLSTQWDLQAGLGYMDVGFCREQTNIQFLDRTYPGIGEGKLLEKSSGTGDKTIYYHYRYQYLHVPVLINYRYWRSGDYKATVMFTGGMAANVLLTHKITAELENFTVDGKKVFHLDSTGYSAHALALNALLGVRIDYKIDKQLSAIVQPMAGLFLFPVSDSPVHVYPFYATVHVGLVYSLPNE